MVSSFGTVVAVAAAAAFVVAVLIFFRLRRQAVLVQRRYDAFGPRFKKHGFAELGVWSHDDTLPMPLGDSPGR